MRLKKYNYFQRVYLPFVIASVVMLVGAVYSERQNSIIHTQDLRNSIRNQLAGYQASLEGALNADIQLVQGLVAVMSTEPDLNQERFEQLGEMVIGSHSGISHLAAAPDLVISLIYPIKGNERALGLDYNKNDAQRRAAYKVRDSGQMVLAGPVNLVQGGSAFIGRFPVFIGTGDDRRFWGILSSVMHADKLFAAHGLTDPDLDIEIALVGRDSMGPQGEQFFGETAIFEDDPVVLDISLPSGSWLIAARPKGGWQARAANPWPWRLVMLVAGTLVLIPFFAAGRLSAARKDIIKTLMRRERQLETLSRRLEVAVEVSKIGIWEYDVKTQEVIWDQLLREIYGLERQEPISLDIWKGFIHPEDRDEAVKTLMRAAEEGGYHTSEYRILQSDGNQRHIRTMGTTFKDGAGGMRMIGVNLDVTRDVHLREKLIEANHALMQRNNELEEARIAAERADRAKTEFLANMSHEIRTPMNGIIGMADLMSESNLGEGERQYLDTIRDSSHALLKIINDILDLSRMEAGKLAISPVDFDLQRCISGAVNLLRPRAREKGLWLSLSFEEGLPGLMRGDDGRIRQVLVNLVGNAVKFTHSGGVDIRVSKVAGDPYHLQIEVEDTGIGIKPEQAAHIFDRFSQADAAITRSFGGTGLGLTISSILASRMGGGITLCEDKQDGACFTLQLRLEPAEGVVQLEEPEQLPDIDRLDGVRILLAEDNKTNRLLVRKYLAGIKCELSEAENGREAIALCQDMLPDIILMDMSMPEIDGLAATREIRSMNLVQPIIVALTANAFDSDREACLAAGMDYFLQKPINKTVLLQTLAMLRASQLEQKQALG
ncbi:hypothetical protein RSK20926_15236 [Roseobacter sp. SK209-2-6]|uniref:ATP-binding protein n=1 Tax=Roseobacter sp. SK209-2-6 TaxID=388739 RepID=UPI0000F3EEE9|nr:ATP-binding protein [Roseobacter sp. SK209-2-6]EBA15583.1 hypothetical protein RSK20926_15236 [Roseobacter sp. SK209-2-6]